MDQTLRRILLVVGALLLTIIGLAVGAGRWMVHNGAMMPTRDDSAAVSRPSPPGAQVIVLKEEEKAKPLTTFEYLTLVTTGVGFAGGIATLVFLIVQTRAATESVKLTVREASMTRTQDIHRIFIENPELRPYFYDGKPADKHDEDYPRILQMAELLCDFYDSLLMQHQLYPGAWEHTRWQRYVETVLNNSPVLREYLADPVVRGWYRRDWPGRSMPDLLTVHDRVQAQAPAAAVQGHSGKANDLEHVSSPRPEPADPNPAARPVRRRGRG